MKSQVLDKGFIEVVDSLGNDLTVVNSARVSFGKRKKYWDKSDRRLCMYLAKHKHYSPFRHLQVQFHIKAPEFVMRQWYKHVVGIETTSNSSTKDHAWNEISGRYVEYDEFYEPISYRKQSDDNKQASEGEFEKGEYDYHFVDANWTNAHEASLSAYKQLIEIGYKEWIFAVYEEDKETATEFQSSHEEFVYDFRAAANKSDGTKVITDQEVIEVGRKRFQKRRVCQKWQSLDK